MIRFILALAFSNDRLWKAPAERFYFVLYRKFRGGDPGGVDIHFIDFGIKRSIICW